MRDRFLRACRCQPVDCTPIWLMRQAGRFLPEYRQLREQHSMMEMIKTPDLAVEATLQPLRRFDLDAAIIFADILPPLEALGVEVGFAKGEGPTLSHRVRSDEDVRALLQPAAGEIAPYTIAAIRLAVRELAGRVPLIGFSGAPFTLAGYLVEGGSSHNFATARRLMLREPAAWHALMARLAQLVGLYLQAQAEAGVQAVQLFDSWVGALSPADYREFVQPYSKLALDMARSTGMPTIHFSTGTGGMLEAVREAGGDVVGVDWRVDLDAAWDRLGPGVGIQGNLDPLLLLGPLPKLLERAGEVLRRAAGRPGHIFNLGHGVLPDTPPEHVAALVEFVHRESKTQGAGPVIA